MGPCTMNIGNAKDPRVAITLHPKNLVMEDGSAVKASRCMAVRNFVKIGTKSTPRTIASLKSNWVRRRPKDAWHIFTSVSNRKGHINVLRPYFLSNSQARRHTCGSHMECPPPKKNNFRMQDRKTVNCHD